MNARLIYDRIQSLKMISLKNVLIATLLMSGTVITIGAITAMSSNALFANMPITPGVVDAD
ncbi:MAG: hypothetical protein ACRC2R_22705 [Xenococcaceae cyanobacterium]